MRGKERNKEPLKYPIFPIGLDLPAQVSFLFFVRYSNGPPA